MNSRERKQVHSGLAHERPALLRTTLQISSHCWVRILALENLLGGHTNIQFKAKMPPGGWSDATTDQRMPAATRSWTRQGIRLFLEPWEGAWPCLHPDFSIVTGFRLLASRTGRESISTVLSHQVCSNLLQQTQETNIESITLFG